LKSADPERRFERCIARLVREDRAIRNLLDQPRPEHRGRNAEDQVAARELFLEVRLGEHAAARVVAAGDGEQRVHAAVGRSVRVADEARLAHRAVRPDERRQTVIGPPLGGERHLGIQRRAGAPGGRLRMAAAAAVQVHRRPQAFVGLVGFQEVGQALVEEGELVLAQAGDRPAGVGPVIAHTRVARGGIERGNSFRPSKQETGRGKRQHQRQRVLEMLDLHDASHPRFVCPKENIEGSALPGRLLVRRVVPSATSCA
jgi:hypothetical protein